MNLHEEGKILVMGPDAGWSEALAGQLSSFGYTAVTAGSGAGAREALRREHFSVVIAESEIQDWKGPRELHALGGRASRPVMLVACDAERRESGVQAVREGAYDYFPRECKTCHLEVAVGRAVRRHCMEERKRRACLACKALGASIPVWIGLGAVLAHVLA